MTAFRDHIIRAVKESGSQAKLATAMGCSQQQISYLLHEANSISLEMAVAIDKATDGVVSRQDLRPDVFGKRRESAA